MTMLLKSMILKLLVSFFYLLAFNVAFSNSLNFQASPNICSQQDSTKHSYDCDLHCISSIIVDEKLLFSENNFSKSLKISFTGKFSKSNNYFFRVNLKNNSPPA